MCRSAAGFDVLRLSYMNAFLFLPVAIVRLLRRLQRRLRPGIPHRSDFRISTPAPVNALLAHVFGAEAPIVRRVNIPFGVSILALARKPAA